MTGSERSGERMTGVRHFLRDDDLSPASSCGPGAGGRDEGRPQRLHAAGRPGVAVIFEKPSLRTRVSFEVGITQLGAAPIIIDALSTHFGRGETVGDAAKVLSRYVDAIVIRSTSDARVAELAAVSAVPVVNASPTGSTPASCSPTCRPCGSGSAGRGGAS